MNFSLNRINYTGKISSHNIGGLPVGGEESFAFHFFEGRRPEKPVLALEIWDIFPEQWAHECRLAYDNQVLNNPEQWAAAAVRAGAQAVNLELKSIDPNGNNAPAEQAVQTVGRVLSAIDVPLIIWGCDNPEKDAEVLIAIAEEYKNKNLVLAPVEEVNYQRLSIAATQYGHTLAASSPIDINLAKQLNILLQNQGVPADKILIDPTTGGLGYGLEYTYSVMERIAIAALQHNDSTLAMPVICNLGKEIWKNKEAKQGLAQPSQENINPGVMMEVSAAVSLLLAGASILVLSHPRSLDLVKYFIDEMYKPSRLEQGDC